jgi:hypothetical protein
MMFQHEGDAALALFETVDLRDVGMVQRGTRLRLAVEASQAVRVGGHRVRQYLDGDLPRQIGVRRPVDLAHAALAEVTGDLIRAEARARRQGHAGDPTRRPSWQRLGPEACSSPDGQPVFRDARRALPRLHR